MVNPLEDKGFQAWLSMQQKKPTAPTKKVYENPNAKKVYGTSQNTLAQSWRGNYLKPLSKKKYGSTYDDKFSNFVKAQGGTDEDAEKFRYWMNKRAAGLKQAENEMEKKQQHQRQVDAYLEDPEAIAATRKKNEASIKQQIAARKTSEPQKSKSAPSLNGLKNFVTSKDTDKDGKPNGLLKALEIIDRPGDAVRTGISEKLKGESFVKGLKAGFTGKKDTSGTQLNKQIAQKLGLNMDKSKKDDVAFDVLSRLTLNNVPGGNVLASALGKKKTKVGEELLGMATETALDPTNLLEVGGAIKAANFLSDSAKTSKAVEPLMKGLLPSNKQTADAISSVISKADVIKPKEFTLPTGQKVHIKNRVTDALKKTESQMDELQPIVSEYSKEFNDAVEQQYQYLKNSMGKGVQQGGVVKDAEGYVTSAYGRISNNPKWYQDFYKQNGRKPNNAELRVLAEQHVKEGFTDEVGDLPAWKPKAVQEIDDQIDELTRIMGEQPDQAEAVRPLIQALEEDRQSVLKKVESAQSANQTLKKQKDSLLGALNIDASPPKNNRFEAIGTMKGNGGKLIRVDDAVQDLRTPKQRTDELINKYKNGNYIPDLPDTSKQISSKTTKNDIPFKDKLSSKKTQAYIDNVDNIHRIKQFTDEVENKLGTVKPEENPYMIGLNSRGGDMVSKQILTENMIDSKGNAVGKSLKDVAVRVPKEKVGDFEDYLVNKHAISRMERGEKVFADNMKMTPDKAAAKVAQYERNNPEFATIAKEYYEYNKQLGEKWLVDTGVIPKDVWEGYLKNNPYYVSNERMFSELEKGNVFNQPKRGFSNQSNPIKKGVGSQRKIVSPFETTIERTAKYVKTAKRNEVMQSLIKNIQKDPEAFKGWAEILPTEQNPGAFLDSLDSKLDGEGFESLLDEFNKAFEQKPDLTKGNIVTGIVGGRKVHLKINDPQLLEALTNLTPQAQGKAIEAVGKVTRLMKTLTTGANPMFSLLRNVWRDIPTAYINSKTTNNPIRFTADLAAAMVDVFGNKESYKAFKAIGGGHSSPISTDVNLLAQSKREILGTKGLRQIPEKGISAIENLSNIVEAAPRLAEFKRIAKNGSYGSKIKGLYEANDITVNFNRYGNNIKQLDAIVPYLNAAVQGLNKLGRVYKDNPIQAGVKTVIGIGIPTAIFQALNYQVDYENYKTLPAYVRDSNYLFPLGNGEFIKIPKPRESGIFGGAIFERLFMAFADKDPNAFEDFSQSILNNFLPPTRLITAPLDDIRANKDFAGRPIVSGDLARLSPRYQYDTKTSEVSKFAGNLFNVSPKQLDYVAKSYTGVLGQLGIPATAKGSTLGETLKRQVVADSVYSNNEVDRFYKLKDKLDTANYDYAATGVQSNYYNDDLRKEFGRISRDMSDVRKEMKAIEKDTSLSDKEKLDRLRNLQQTINELAKKGNTQSGGMR